MDTAYTEDLIVYFKEICREKHGTILCFGAGV
jgi:hypothetical protein